MGDDPVGLNLHIPVGITQMFCQDAGELWIKPLPVWSPKVCEKSLALHSGADLLQKYLKVIFLIRDLSVGYIRDCRNSKKKADNKDVVDISPKFYKWPVGHEKMLLINKH